jgi:hypothetical protein
LLERRELFLLLSGMTLEVLSYIRIDVSFFIVGVRLRALFAFLTALLRSKRTRKKSVPLYLNAKISEKRFWTRGSVNYA